MLSFPHRRSAALLAASSILLAASGFALVASSSPTFFEVEPNDDKAQANHVPLFGTGYCAIEGTGDSSGPDRDYYELQPAIESGLQPYEYRLDLDWISTLNTGFLRGLEQSRGVVDADSDVAVQRSEHRHTGELKWYGFGKGERLYFDAGDLDFFRFMYHVEASRNPHSVVPISTSFDPGEITITSVGQGHATDTDLWVYDERWNALPGYGNDDDASLTSRGSTLTRPYAPGRYYLAITNGNLANDEASPPDDPRRSEPVLDFPDAVVSSSRSQGEDLSFTITDGVNSEFVAASKVGPYDVAFYSFDVGGTRAIQPYCDASEPTPCPCGNDSVAIRGDGCVNSTGRGGLLYASGSTRVSTDDLAFHAHGLPPGQASLLVVGDQASSVSTFGDGLLCVGGSLKRLGLRSIDERGEAGWSSVGAKAGWSAGDVRYLQAWYRDPAGRCGQGFSTTNALEVHLTP